MRSKALMLRSERPPRALGVLVATGGTALATLVIYPLEHLAPVVSLGGVYLLVVVLFSVYWGALLGLATAIVSALAFNYFHLPPVGRLALVDSRDWVALLAFVVVGARTGFIGRAPAGA